VQKSNNINSQPALPGLFFFGLRRITVNPISSSEFGLFIFKIKDEGDDEGGEVIDENKSCTFIHTANDVL